MRRLTLAINWDAGTGGGGGGGGGWNQELLPSLASHDKHVVDIAETQVFLGYEVESKSALLSVR